MSWVVLNGEGFSSLVERNAMLLELNGGNAVFAGLILSFSAAWEWVIEYYFIDFLFVCFSNSVFPSEDVL